MLLLKKYFYFWAAWVAMGWSLGNLSAQTQIRTLFKLPDTGLQTGYTTTAGEDNDFQINAPKYVNLGRNIILDSNTLLLWQQTDGGEMTFENAQKYCDTLTLGGYTDWRLPTALESYSIIYIQRTNPSINTTYFTNTGAEYWWTSEKQWNDSSKIWVTNAGGGIGNHSKTETISAGGTKKFHVRAVRNTWSKTIHQRFSTMGNVVVDSMTSLLWLQLPDTASKTWEEALNFAQNFTIDEYSDWRLPNIKELQTINSLNYSSPSIDRSTFPGISTTQYWSSTTTPNQIDKAWYLDTKFGITTYALKTSKKRVWLVSQLTPQASTRPALLTNSLQIFPNPSAGRFWIKSSGTPEQIPVQSNETHGELVIYQTNGKLVYKSQVNTEEFIDLKFLESGSYRLEFKNTEGTILVHHWVIITR